MIHLTETGVNAGRLLCLSDRAEKQAQQDIFNHFAYAPMHDPNYRMMVCPECLKAYADFAFEDGDDMPDWVFQIRNCSQQFGGE